MSQPKVFISNGERTLEVTHLNDRGVMGVLEWINEDYGVHFAMPVAEANAQGFLPVEAP